MIDLERLQEAFAPYDEAMGDIGFAAHMAGIDENDLRWFVTEATAHLPTVMEGTRIHRTYAGLLAVGVVLGVTIARQERGE